MVDWLAWLKWLNPKQWAMAALRDEIKREINQHIEAHRKRIAELDQWNEITKERIEEINKLDIEKITKKAEQAAALSEEKAKFLLEGMMRYVRLYGTSVGVLAKMAHTYPVDWEFYTSNLNPEVRQFVDEVKATFPRPTLPPPLNIGLGLGGMLDAGSQPPILPVGTLLAEGGKDKDKDPSKR